MSIEEATSSNRLGAYRPSVSMAVVCIAAIALVGCGNNTSSEETECCLPHGAIGARYIAIGGEEGPLGPCTEQEHSRDDGRAQDFTHGSIYWTEQTGAWAVYGDIGAKYTDIGGPASPLGWPIDAESSTPNEIGRFSAFEEGNIYFSPAGTYPVYGAIFAAWGRQGFESGKFGFPVSDEYDVADGRQTDFQGGWIRWIADTNEIVTS